MYIWLLSTILACTHTHTHTCKFGEMSPVQWGPWQKYMACKLAWYLWLYIYINSHFQPIAKLFSNLQVAFSPNTTSQPQILIWKAYGVPTYYYVTIFFGYSQLSELLKCFCTIFHLRMSEKIAVLVYFRQRDHTYVCILGKFAWHVFLSCPQLVFIK